MPAGKHLQRCNADQSLLHLNPCLCLFKASERSHRQVHLEGLVRLDIHQASSFTTSAE